MEKKNETINHILFQCRVAKEIWILAPVVTPSDDKFSTQDLFQNINSIFCLIPRKKGEHSLLPFLGWNLWKARNALAFDNKREHLAYIVSRALMEYRLWIQACEEAYKKKNIKDRKSKEYK